MLPVYFLSILFNGLTGLILVFGKEETEDGALALSFNNEIFRLITGVLSVFTGIMKLLAPMANNFPVVGDMLPALIGIAGGFILIFEFYRHRTPDSPSFGFLERAASFIGRYRIVSGIVCLGTAAIHLIFYQINFL